MLAALRTVRIMDVSDEPAIHDKIKAALTAAGIPYRHEYPLITHKRFDFWIDGIVLEIKKVKPPKDRLLIQLRRYTAVPEVRTLILVFWNFQGTMRGLGLPDTINGKPVIVFSLNRNWGVAV